jgi:hypothetical protein
MTFDEKGKVVKSVQPIKTPVRTRSYFQVCGVWEGWKGDFFKKNRLKGHINWRKIRHLNVI